MRRSAGCHTARSRRPPRYRDRPCDSNSSTMMPAATGKPASRRQLDIGQHADADHDEVGGHVAAVAEADAGHFFAVALDAGGLYAQMNPDTGRGVAGLEKIPRSPRSPPAPSRGVPSSTTSTSRPLARAVAANSSPMKPAPITTTRWPDRSGGARPRFRRASASSARFEIGVGNIEQAITRAGRQHQVAVVERGPDAERQFVRAAVDRRPRDRRSGRYSGRDRICPAGTSGCQARRSLQIGLGQRRPLVRADGSHRSGARSVRQSHAGEATPQAESPHGRRRQSRLVLAQRPFVIGTTQLRCAQELPMSSPRSADFGLLASRGAALVSACPATAIPIRPYGLETRKSVCLEGGGQGRR